MTKFSLTILPFTRSFSLIICSILPFLTPFIFTSLSFSDIDFYVNEIKGDSIYLELFIVELPKLGDVKIKGVKKGKIDEIIN